MSYWERKGILGKIYFGDKRGETETVSRDGQMVNDTAARIRKMQSVGMNERWHCIQCNEHKDWKNIILKRKMENNMRMKSTSARLSLPSSIINEYLYEMRGLKQWLVDIAVICRKSVTESGRSKNRMWFTRDSGRFMILNHVLNHVLNHCWINYSDRP